MVAPSSMSLHFDFYDANGELLASNIKTSYMILYDYYDNLNAIHERFFEAYSDPMYTFNSNWRYASPSHIKDYMFDIKTGELLPNRFLK